MTSTFVSLFFATFLLFSLPEGGLDIWSTFCKARKKFDRERVKYTLNCLIKFFIKRRQAQSFIGNLNRFCYSIPICLFFFTPFAHQASINSSNCWWKSVVLISYLEWLFASKGSNKKKSMSEFDKSIDSNNRAYRLFILGWCRCCSVQDLISTRLPVRFGSSWRIKK